MIVTYDPPYDSPIEDVFAMNFAKYASDDATMAPQVTTQTLCGNFILDFVLSRSNGYRVAIECDGKEFHDASRDEWRDAMILGERHVDAIYRIRGCDIVYNISDVLFILSKMEPSLFSERGQTNLNYLAGPAIRAASIDRNASQLDLRRSNQGALEGLRVEIRRIDVPNNERRFWQSAYQHAVSVGGGALDDVITKYRQIMK